MNKKLENIITSKEYYNLKETEKHDFLLKNTIYTKRNSKPDDERYIEGKEKKECWLLDEYYMVNPIIINNIISLFLKYPIGTNHIKEKIKVDISNSLDVKETIKLWHKEYNDIIKEIKISPLNFYADNKIDKNKLKTYITTHFKSPNCGCLHIRIIEAYILKMEFDLYHISFFEGLINAITCTEILHFLKEQMQKNVENKSKSKQRQLTTRQAVLLIEEMMRLENWTVINTSKKATVISRLIGRDYDNIREVYTLSGKKSKEMQKLFEEDMKLVYKLIKDNKLN